MFYYDMNIIRPNLSFTTTINPELVHTHVENNKQLVESFNSCFCLNKNCYDIRKEILYHKQWDIFKNIINDLENENQIKILYQNKIEI